MILKSYNNITTKIKERYRCYTNIYELLKFVFQNIVILWLIHSQHFTHCQVLYFFLPNYEIAPDLCYNVWKLCYLVAVTNSWLFFVTLNMNSSV